MKNDCKYENFNKRNRWRSARERERERYGVFGGSWRMECVRKSEYGKSEINDKRQEI